MASGEFGQKRGMRVRPLNRVLIRHVASAARSLCDGDPICIDVVRYLEHTLAKEYDLVLAVVPETVLGADEGRTYPDQRIIQLREDMYDRLLEGDPRARFTAMHEVGHLLLHEGVPLRLATGPTNHDWFEDSEWQADAFAAEFLMPVHLMRAYQTAAAASVDMGVSLTAAIIRMKILKKEGKG